jgi:hypothetical protein
MLLNRQSILDADDSSKDLACVDLPEWGGAAFVRVMTGSQRDRLEIIHAKGAGDNFRARVVAFTLCDERGRLIFNEADIPALGAKSGAVLDRISEVAIRVNKLGPKDLEDAAKN